jgi:hypothetical protein
VSECVIICWFLGFWFCFDSSQSLGVVSKMSILNSYFNASMQYLLSTLLPGRFPPPPITDDASTMSAVVMNEHGDASILKFSDKYPAPKPRTDVRQVMVEIVAAGMNPVDFKLRTGPIAGFLLPKPKILGSDFAGIVMQTPQNSPFQVNVRSFPDRHDDIARTLRRWARESLECCQF